MSFRSFTAKSLGLTLALLVCGGCKTKEAPKVVEVDSTGEAPPPAPARRRMIGTVETVYPDQGFALIRRSTDYIPVEGSRLIAEGRTAPSQLIATQHRKGTFFSADIEEGLPRPGDDVRLLTRADASEPSEQLTLPDPTEWAARTGIQPTQSGEQAPAPTVGGSDETESLLSAEELARIAAGPFSLNDSPPPRDATPPRPNRFPPRSVFDAPSNLPPLNPPPGSRPSGLPPLNSPPNHSGLPPLQPPPSNLPTLNPPPPGR